MKNSKERVNLHSQLYNLHSEYGGVAQLGEHLPCKQGVRSSILLISTIPQGKPEGIRRIVL